MVSCSIPGSTVGYLSSGELFRGVGVLVSLCCLRRRPFHSADYGREGSNCVRVPVCCPLKFAPLQKIGFQVPSNIGDKKREKKKTEKHILK